MSEDLIKRSDAIEAIFRMSIPHDIASAHYANMFANAVRAVPSADIPSVDKDYLISLIQEAVYDGEACARLMDMVDRPQGDVDAVDIFEREMHNLEQGYITLGEFDERIEPLRHLYYGRPQGEWIPCSERLPKVRTDVLLQFKDNMCVGFLSHGDWNINSGGGYYIGVTQSEEQPVAWMPLPEPWKGADDE